MSAIEVLVAGAMLLLGASACSSSNEDVTGRVCRSDDAPAACLVSCAEGEEPGGCEAGFYCGAEGSCTADCDDSIAFACASGQACRTEEGRCVPQVGGGSSCGDVSLTTTMPIPNVYLILDQSSSMIDADFPAGSGTTRWDAVRNFLLGTPQGNGRRGGFLREVQNIVRFGLAMYTSFDNGDGNVFANGRACPMINNANDEGSFAGDTRQAPLPPALQAYESVEALYGDARAYLNGNTPTGDAIDFLLEDDNLGIDNEDPTIFVLATDGEPDTCAQPDPQQGQAEAIAAVTRAFARGIRTIPIAVGGEVGDAHMQAIASAGSGGAEDATFYRPEDVATLRASIDAVVRESRPCSFATNGRIVAARACEGSVTLTLNAGSEDATVDETIPCLEAGEGERGWRSAADGTEIELVGSACDDFRSSETASVNATFPCQAAQLLM